MLTLRILCQCSSTMMILSPTPTVVRIYKTKDVGIASVVPLVAVFGNSFSWMLYGYMGRNIFPIFINFVTGVVVSSIFIAVYYHYTPDRRRVRRVLAFETVALSIVTTYFFLAIHGVTHQSRESATLVVGAMGIFFSMKLYGAGLERIKLVLRHKMGIYIPIHMVIMGTVVLYVVYYPGGGRQGGTGIAAKLGSANSRPREEEISVVVASVVSCTSTSAPVKPQKPPHPSPTMYRIYKTKSVGITSVIPLVSVLGNCHMWMLYGILYHRFFPVVTTFALGDAIALVFIAIYYRYTSEQRYVLKVFGVAVSALLVMTVYTALGANGWTHQKRSEVQYIVGSVGIFVSVLLYGAGFEKIVQVLKFKTAIFIPIHMVVAGTVNQALWLAYLGLDKNWLMLSSSIICTTLCVAQLVLYAIYHPARCPLPVNYGKEASNVILRNTASISGANELERVSVVVDLAVPKGSGGYHLALTPRE
ncbi:hypothetical protein PybrP1_007580 [[Pythium] brassicae (nom. inval.)]|nr:hypothetical protein PybrP1_007580 [[Pythium] brassicae (nom. inval.)]